MNTTTKPKAIWINSPNTSSWYSAQVLSDGFLERCKKEFDLTFARSDSPILPEGYSLYIFGSFHYPKDFILSHLSSLAQDSKVLFHLYGDISSRIRLFLDHWDLFKHLSIKFVLGSQASYEVAFNILPSKNLLYLPFVPNVPSVADTLKDKPDTKKIIYFGRVSYFKNVHHLVQLFNEFTDSHPDYELHIVGGVDNIRWRNNPTASYFNYTGDLLSRSIESAVACGKKVTYHGKLPQLKLFKLLSEMSIFTTLSTCEEEDFGLAIFEALQHNLRVVATRWGGHRQFSSLHNVSLVRVEKQAGSLVIDRDSLFDCWLRPSGCQEQKCNLVDQLEEWRQYPLKLDHWSNLGPFNQEFIKLRSISSINQEFFQHAQEILHPMWR